MDAKKLIHDLVEELCNHGGSNAITWLREDFPVCPDCLEHFQSKFCPDCGKKLVKKSGPHIKNQEDYDYHATEFKKILKKHGVIK